MVRLSDELGHRGYPRLLPEGTAAFHRELLPRAWGGRRFHSGPDPLSLGLAVGDDPDPYRSMSAIHNFVFKDETPLSRLTP
jgi:hypothetical protein